MPAVDDPRGHTPVLPREVADQLAVREGETVVDATVGLGGHAKLLSTLVGESGRLIGLDVDPANLEVSRATLARVPCRVDLIHANFAELHDVLDELGVARVDVILADLGVSSAQLEDARRGLSFQHEGPLDMRLDPRLKETAADLVNRLKERELGDLIYFNAQETASRKIARRICEARRSGRITTTKRLVEIVTGAVGVRDPASRRSKIHPATRTFQALQIGRASWRERV